MSTDCPPNFHRGQNSIESSKGPIGNSVFINGQIKGRLHLMFGIYPKKFYMCTDFIIVFAILTNVATKIQQILEANPSLNVLFGEWLAGQGLDVKGHTPI